MGMYALVRDNVVVAVESLDESVLPEYAEHYQNIFGIDDLPLRPEAGWVLVGNHLEAPPIIPDPEKPEYYLELRCRQARQFGQGLSMIAADKIGGRNLMLGKTEAQIQTFATQLMSLKLILDGGALVTAYGIMSQMKAVYPEYADLFSWAMDQITEYRSRS